MIWTFKTNHIFFKMFKCSKQTQKQGGWKNSMLIPLFFSLERLRFLCWQVFLDFLHQQRRGRVEDAFAEELRQSAMKADGWPGHLWWTTWRKSHGIYFLDKNCEGDIFGNYMQLYIFFCIGKWWQMYMYCPKLQCWDQWSQRPFFSCQTVPKRNGTKWARV